MNSARNIVIQSVLKPATVYVEYEKETVLKTYTTYEDLFHILEPIVIDSDTKIFVNRGPGSYTGIRTALTYVLGLMHGGLISGKQVVPYTSFDLLSAVSGKNEPLFLKSWPRLANGLLTGSKGYFKKGSEVAFVEYDVISTLPGLVIYTEETDITEALPSDTTHIASTTIATEELLEKLIASTIETQPIDPLYINPVNATVK